MKLLPLVLSLSALSTISHANTMTYDYVTSVKVNQIKLNTAIAADQVEKLLQPKLMKTSKVFVECTGNYEYSAKPSADKALVFEIFTEDNPQIKNAHFFQNKNNFRQLGQTKGRIGFNWNNPQSMTESIVVQNIPITAQYTLQQFKHDFKHSAQLMSASGEAQVLILERNQVTEFLKHPQAFTPPYTAYLNFHFKNGKLTQFAIQQALAC